MHISSEDISRFERLVEFCQEMAYGFDRAKEKLSVLLGGTGAYDNRYHHYTTRGQEIIKELKGALEDGHRVEVSVRKHVREQAEGPEWADAESAHQLFETFKAALYTLSRASYSAKQGMDHGLGRVEAKTWEEQELDGLRGSELAHVFMGLKANVEAKDSVSALEGDMSSFTYTTGRGVDFSFHLHEQTGRWSVVVSHPSGSFNPGSSLGRALRKHGFAIEDMEDMEDEIETYANFEQTALDRSGVSRGRTHDLHCGDHRFDMAVVKPGKVASQAFLNNRGASEPIGGQCFKDPEAFADWIAKDIESEW